MPSHIHNCAVCNEPLICCCSDKSKRVLCETTPNHIGCAEIEQLLRQFFPEEAVFAAESKEAA